MIRKSDIFGMFMMHTVNKKSLVRSTCPLKQSVFDERLELL